MATKNKTKVSVGEIIFYVIGGLAILAGVVLGILGIVARQISDLENALVQSQQRLIDNSKLDYSQLGAIIALSGTIVVMITLVVAAKRVDLENEKRARRAQRLSLLNEETEANTVVETEVVEETPKEE
ncbi:MAG: hypothetical protein ACOX28_03940 [Bacilli bacterium]|jgi:hypothetical protein